MIHKPGVYEGMSEEEYFEDESFSKSQVEYILKSPQHLEAYRKTGRTSKAFEDGKLIDTLILTPEEFTSRYEIEPATYMNSKGILSAWTYKADYCKEWRDKIQEKGISVISQDQLEKAKTIRDSVMLNSTAMELLEGIPQVSLFWVDNETGVPCKGRIDVLRAGGMTDLKSTTDATKNAFRRAIDNFKYHVQAFAYTDGYETITTEKIGFDFIAVEKELPYYVKCYSLREDSLLVGEYWWKKALRKYAEYLEKGIEEESGLELIEIPLYSLKVLDCGEEEDLIL